MSEDTYILPDGEEVFMDRYDDYFVDGGSVYLRGQEIFNEEDVSNEMFARGPRKVHTFLLQDMARRKYWPNVWFINDHGNVTLYDVTKRGLKEVAAWV